MAAYRPFSRLAHEAEEARPGLRGFGGVQVQTRHELSSPQRATFPASVPFSAFPSLSQADANPQTTSGSPVLQFTRKRKPEDGEEQDKKPASKAPRKRKTSTAVSRRSRAADDEEEEEDADDEQEEPGDTTVLKDEVGFSGVKQQGQFSKSHGKEYLAPGSYKKRRAEQTGRQVTNLVLNRLTEESRVADQPKKAWQKKYRGELEKERKKLKLPAKRGKGAKSDKDKEAESQAKETVGTAPPGSKIKPVEVQTQLVGGRLLLSTNNPLASRNLSSGIKASGGLLPYLNLASGSDFNPKHSAQQPALDKDRYRPQRYHTKLADALEGERHWQQDPKDEEPEDVLDAQAILEAAKSQGVGDLDPNDETGLAETLKQWNEPTAPRVYVSHHKLPEVIKNEHAERVSSKIRKEHLQPFEGGGRSTGTVGPKTPCLGCETKHRAHYSDFTQPSPVSGAYFGGSSPVQTAEEVETAKKLATSRPSTGSIGIFGSVRNSDHQDSDSDEEGNPFEWVPKGEKYKFGEKSSGATRVFRNAKGDEKSFKAAELKKRQQQAAQRAAKRRERLAKNLKAKREAESKLKNEPKNKKVKVGA